jgi:hypothetical protein
MRQEDSRRPVWVFADRVQITQSVLEAQWKALVVPAPSRRLFMRGARRKTNITDMPAMASGVNTAELD